MVDRVLPVQVIGTVLAIFLLLLVGYSARRFGALKAGDASVINSIILNLTMPAFIFVALYGTRISVEQVLSPVVGLGAEILVMFLAYLVARSLRLDRRTTGALMLVSAFGNTGFLGYPVTVAAFPGDRDALATAVMFDEFGMALPLYLIGVGVASTFGSSRFEISAALACLRTPVFVSTVIALLIKNQPMPQPILTSITYLGAATVPLAMISLGLSLTGGHFRSSLKPTFAALVLKMAIMPVMVYVGMKAVGAEGTVLQVSVLEAAMPPAIMSGVVAARYGANGAFAASTIFALTLLSVILIPLVLLLLT